ncbi:WG repeat-containing protein [Sphingobacterium alkalisoli]|nr:WG repeat-containing protein [Sphingobacterium alkalisoli]
MQSLNKLMWVLLLVPFVGCSQNKQFSNDDYLYLVVDTTGTLMKYGYKDEQGKMVIPFGKYYMCFTDTIKTIGFVAIPKQGFWAINKNEDQLFKVYVYDNGPDRVRDGLFRILDEHDLIGFANMLGEVVIQPRFERVDHFSEGLAGFCEDCLYEPVLGLGGVVDNKALGRKIRGKYGFINKKGEVVIAPKFDSIRWFENGRAKVGIGDKEFYIDKMGSELLFHNDEHD